MLELTLPEKLEHETKTIKFLEGVLPDHKGRYVTQYLDMDEQEMEDSHDWIQYAFPINTPSVHNPDTPLYFGIMKYNYATMARQERLATKYMASIGLYKDERKDAYGNPTSYIRMDREKFYSVVDKPYNHHIKRISRLLKHLMLSHRQPLLKHLMLSHRQPWMAKAIFQTLVEDELITHRREPFTTFTFAYWSSIVLEFDDRLRDLV